MKNPTIKILTAILLLQGSAAYAVEGIKPTQDGYGFDWLNPEAATCVKMTDKLMATFKRCKFEKSAGFDGNTDAFTCTVSNKIEYIIFSSKAVCIDQLETMKANGD